MGCISINSGKMKIFLSQCKQQKQLSSTAWICFLGKPFSVPHNIHFHSIRAAKCAACTTVRYSFSHGLSHRALSAFVQCLHSFRCPSLFNKHQHLLFSSSPKPKSHFYVQYPISQLQWMVTFKQATLFHRHFKLSCEMLPNAEGLTC